MTIRSARPGDADAVFALLQQLAESYLPDRAAFDETFASFIAEGSNGFILVEESDEGVVRGYTLTTVSRLLHTNGPGAQLQELVVEESARGQRIGASLVTATEDECRSRGVRQLTVASRRGAGFYEGLGYLSTADFLKRVF
ncbi:GNAT family N-acetyltransferase [Glaciihabitans arcticus]|uniref:GNAT family N-acetyltransferase n=1 Tax=Glaciihabitans arcticus TaxID=2668039 RepID=A0A4Q9GWG9_9MICO|nr:GNAT family N-acetyltransferase [Glaciihabitans arcticus]TBN56570.1 GNAT family N-acetyltransferase [Glaciihabitans arcticus]